MCLLMYLFTQVNTSINKYGEIITYTHKSYFVCIVLSSLVFSFFAGVRWDVGIDHLSYLYEYENYNLTKTISREDLETGFVFLIKIFNEVGFHFAFFFGFIALVQISMAYSYFRNAKYLIPFVSVFIICGGDFFLWMNAIRQNIVASVFLFLAANCIIQRRFLLYLASVYLLTFIHKSAFFLIPFYACTYFPLERFYIKKNIQLVIFFGALILSSFNLWVHLLDITELVFTQIGYDERFDMEKLADNIRSQNFGARKIIFFVIDLIIILYSNKLRKAFPDKLFGFSLILFIILYTTQPIFVNSMVFSRIIGYYYISRVIMASYLCFYLTKYRPSFHNYWIAVIIFALFILHILIQIYVDSGGHTDCIRYQFFWEQLNF